MQTFLLNIHLKFQKHFHCKLKKLQNMSCRNKIQFIHQYYSWKMKYQFWNINHNLKFLRLSLYIKDLF